jgi:hypothetical protein
VPDTLPARGRLQLDWQFGAIVHSEVRGEQRGDVRAQDVRVLGARPHGGALTVLSSATAQEGPIEARIWYGQTYVADRAVAAEASAETSDYESCHLL